MQGRNAWAVRAACLVVMTLMTACSGKTASEQAAATARDIIAQNAAIDRQIPALCLRVIEAKKACFSNKLTVDLAKGNQRGILSDRVQLIEAGQDRTVTLHNAILFRGPAKVELECRQWASRVAADLAQTQAEQIRAEGGDPAPCERAVSTLAAAVALPPQPSLPKDTGGRAAPLTAEECDRLVRRSLFNLQFKPNDPMKARFVADCVAGRDYFTRGYFNCVFAAKYSDAMDCAYAARGIDRSRSFPELASRQVGDDGSYNAQARMPGFSNDQDNDPHTAIDRLTRDQYLSKRDNILRSLGETPPADGHLPFHSSHRKLVAKGLSYWVIHEDFKDLQLARIDFDDAAGYHHVICARYGSTDRLTVGRGFCAALIEKYFHTELSE